MLFGVSSIFRRDFVADLKLGGGSQRIASEMKFAPENGVWRRRVSELRAFLVQVPFHLFASRLSMIDGHISVHLEAFELRKTIEVLESKTKRKSKAKRAERKGNREETKETIFDGAIPRRAVSKDNFDVVWHFPNAIGPLGTVSVDRYLVILTLTFHT